LGKSLTDIYRSNAVIIKKQTFQLLLRPILKSFSGKDNEHSDLRIFIDEDSALKWLDKRKTFMETTKGISPIVKLPEL
jgi:hypothetical protein